MTVLSGPGAQMWLCPLQVRNSLQALGWTQLAGPHHSMFCATSKSEQTAPPAEARRFGERKLQRCAAHSLAALASLTAQKPRGPGLSIRVFAAGMKPSLQRRNPRPPGSQHVQGTALTHRCAFSELRQRHVISELSAAASRFALVRSSLPRSLATLSGLS